MCKLFEIFCGVIFSISHRSANDQPSKAQSASDLHQVSIAVACYCVPYCRTRIMWDHTPVKMRARHILPAIKYEKCATSQ